MDPGRAVLLPEAGAAGPQEGLLRIRGQVRSAGRLARPAEASDGGCMALIPDRSLKQLFELNKSFWATVSRDPSVPQSVKSMIYQHIIGFWTPDSLAVVVSPLADGLEHFLQQPVFDLDGLQYYYPSLKFWLAHANASHSPEGTRCSVSAHISFLTREGSNAEFIYSVVTRNGEMIVQDAERFSNECAFFKSGVN